MEQFLEVFKFLGLDPALLAVASLLAVLLRFARGMIHWVDSRWTFGCAVLLAVGGAVLKMSEHEPWRATTWNALAILVVVLAGQRILQKLAETVNWLPKDNEWLVVKPKP